MWPPSTPISAAILPCLCASRISPAVVTRSISRGCRRTCSRTASIWSIACLTATGPVILLGIHIEKKIAPSPPSFMRGMSMLPVALRAPKSKSPSKKRWVVSSCVSTTIDAKCSLRARAEISSARGVAVMIAPATTHNAAVPTKMFRSISPRCIPLKLLLRLEFVARPLHLLHYPQRVLTQNIPDILVRIAFAQQGLGNSRQFRAILHPFRHRSAVKIRAQANMVSANQFNSVVDVIDNSLPAHVRQLPFLSHLSLQRDRSSGGAFLVVATFLDSLAQCAYDASSSSRLIVSIFVILIDEALLVINVDNAALCSQCLDHLIGHVAHMIAKRAAGRV